MESEEVELRSVLEPSASSEVVRLGIAGYGSSPPEVFLVRGTLGPRQLKDLEYGSPSEAVVERLIPTMSYEEGGFWFTAPTETLELGRHTFGVAKHETTFAIDVQPTDHLRKVFPSGQGGVGRVMAYCASLALEGASRDVILPGTDQVARATVGTPLGRARKCALLTLDSDSLTGEVAPPFWLFGLPTEPTPVQMGESTPVEPVACTPAEVDFGPACLLVDDDRVVVKPPKEPLFWVFSTFDGEWIRSSERGQPMLLQGFTPDSSLMLSAEIVGIEGEVLSLSKRIETPAARAHVVLSEIYSNPVGPEPAQEWIELANDGQVDFPLDGLVVEDLGGAITLETDAVLAPGAFAVLVNEGFDDTNPFDVAIAEQALIVRVPELGHNGLANDGEPLRLRGADGMPIDFALPARLDPGESHGRLDPSGLPEDPKTWTVFAVPTPGAANAL